MGVLVVVGSAGGTALAKRVVQAVAEADALLMQEERMFATWFILACSGVATTVTPAVDPLRVVVETVWPVERLTRLETVLNAFGRAS